MSEEPRTTPEQRTRTGILRVPATPRDVIHILIGSFFLVLCFAVALTASLMGVWWLLGVVPVVAIIVIVDIVLAMRRQRKLGTGPRSRG